MTAAVENRHAGVQPDQSDTPLHAFDLLQSGVAVLDTGRRFVYYNPAFARFLGEQTGLELTVQDLLGQALPIQTLWDCEPAGTGIRWELLAPGGRHKLVAERISTGSPLSVLHDDANYFLQLHAVTNAEQEAVNLGNAITVGQHDDKEKLELLSSFSHEFRTPLNAVLGFGNLLLGELNSNQSQREYVEGIISAGSHLLKLVNEILTLSKAEYNCSEIALSTENVDVDEVVKDCVALMQPLALSANVSLVHQGKAARLICDPTRLRQVLLNLLSNAIKYNKDGGKVVIRCDATGGRCSGIEVRDTGTGIPEELLETIFNPFKRLLFNTGNLEGSGIGLMLTRRLVNMMGGQIRVASRPGSGSVFAVDFNLEEDMAGTAGIARQDVVWIGADSESRRFVAQLLGLRPRIKMRSYDGIARLEPGDLSRRPDLVLLDCARLNGQNREAALQLKALVQDVPAIAVSDSVDPEIDQLYADIGVCDRVATPVDPVHFLELADQHLEAQV